MLTPFLLTGCEYLNEEPYHWITSDDIFTIESSYILPVNEAYRYIRGGFNRVNGAFLEASIDDGMSTIRTSNVHKIARGYISANSPIENCWSNSYQGIRQALFAHKYLQETTLMLNGRTEEQIQELKDIYCSELVCLRALFEFELLRHYGGYPIIDQLYDLGDNAVVDQIGRSSFEECVNHIVELCDTAAAGLGVAPQGGNGAYGRMTKGVAMAIKAKTLLFAASPLYNQEGNTNPLLGYTDLTELKARWEAAAKACDDIFKLNVYELTAVTDAAPYEAMFNISPNKEYILFNTEAKGNAIERRHYPPTLSISQGGGTVPTQELVDAFTMADGIDFVRSASGDPQYSGRDPRLNAVIGYNGSKYGKRTIYTQVGDGQTPDALNVYVDRSTTTGYYLAKFCKRDIDFEGAKPTTTFHLFPIIRLADIYLAYAEAMTNAYGPDSDPKGYGMTAKQAVAAVRARAGFTTDVFLDGVTTKEAMMKKIKQERRVELCFEEQRYYDLRRWMDGDVLNKPVTGIRIENNDGELSYSYFEADKDRRFDDRMYYHPIPYSVIQKSKGVIAQNPGW